MVATTKTLKWAITGANGQLGRELGDLLDSKGEERISWSSSELDIGEESSIEKVVDSQPSILVNCAAWTAVDKAESHQNEAFQVNETGAANMASAAKRLGIPLVHISTDYVFSGHRDTPWRVDDQTEPISMYGKSKLAGEIAIGKIYPEGSYILRTAWLYSSYGNNFAKTIIRKALADNEPLKVVNDQIGQPTYARDLAMQIAQIPHTELPFGIYHATNSGTASWFDFAKKILELNGQPINRLIPVTSSEFPSPVRRPSYSVLDNSKWLSTKITAMRDWSSALEEALPLIMDSVRAESKNG